MALLGSLLLVGSSTSVSANGGVRVPMLGELPFLDWIAAEPRFKMTRAPFDPANVLTFSDALRFARVYLPRAEADLKEGYEGAVFGDFAPTVIPRTTLNWFQSAVYEGMGLALIEFANWGGYNRITEWMVISFYDVFPADVYLNVFPAAAGRAFYVVQNPNGPLGLPGIEAVPMNAGYHGDLGARLGSTVEAIWKGRRTPAMVTSTYGEGHTLQLDQGWDNIPGATVSGYQYLPEFIYNQLYYIAGISYPEDLQLVHVTRGSLIAYHNRKQGTLAVVDFIEKFGANPAKIYERIEQMDARYGNATEIYLEGEYEEAGDTLYGLLEEFTEVEDDLMEIRDRAFLWIYFIEWSSVTAAGAFCGVALWSLMIRRRLYRYVGTTRPDKV